jgi:hypothetical protein
MSYEIDSLVEKLKGKGMPVAEEAAKQVAEAVFEWLEESIIASENKYDDVAIAFIPMIKEHALKEIEKINP